MKKTIILCVLCLLSSVYTKVTAQASWLPAVKDVNKNIRLLECSYNEAELKHCEEINPSSNWEVRTEQAMAMVVNCIFFLLQPDGI